MSWHLIRSGGEGEEFGNAHKEFLLDSSSDIQSEPTNFGPIAMGSTAHTGGYADMFEKDASGTWQTIISSADNTGNIHVSNNTVVVD